MNSCIFHVLKRTEGGPGSAMTIARLKQEGINARRFGPGSYYVGHVAIEVFGNKRTLNRAEKIIF